VTWTSAAFLAAETAARTAGRPLLIGSHLGDGTLPIWTSDTGAATDTDEAATGAEGYYAVDRRGSRQSYPGTTAATEWWLVLGAVSGTFDHLALINTNLASLAIAGGIVCEVQVADNAAFSTNLETVYSATPTQDRWLDRMDERWTGFGYARLHLTAASAFVPRLGEAWIGHSRQLRGGIRTGRDVYGLSSRLGLTSAEGPSVISRARALGAHRWPASIRVLDTAPTLLDSASVRAWWAETDYGVRPFLYRASVASPHRVHIMTTEATELDLPRASGPYEQVLEQTWTETPPFQAAE
jgi:hypothetical protein